jgi:UDP-2,3-diacylglucosamine pyrophosphatase LpxH
MDENVVYFLGAGASKSLGYPLTNEIMPMILESLLKKDLFQLGDAKSALERAGEKKLLRWLHLLYPGLKNVKISNGNPTSKVPTITEILSIVDHFFFYNTPPHPEISDGHLADFRDLLSRAIGELMTDFEETSFTTEEKALLEKFIRPIRNDKMSKKVTVITTNYDLLIDNAFQSAARQNRIDYGISYRDVNSSELIFRHGDPLIHYYKLHGSLNWLRCDLCGHYYINPEGTIIAQAFNESVEQDNTCICSDRLRLKSVLVAPSLVRDIRDPNLLQIWKASMEAIRTANHLIMIGYSLPAEDLGIRSIIMRGLNGRDRRKKLKVDVVQYGNDSKPNYINLFGQDINYYDKGLENYLK